MAERETDIKDLLYGSDLIRDKSAKDSGGAAPGSRGPSGPPATTRPDPVTPGLIPVGGIPGLIPMGNMTAVGLSEIIAGLAPTLTRPVREAPAPKDMGGATPGSQGPGMPDPADQPTEVKIIKIKPKIHNAQNYNLGRLRYIGDVSKYLEDPIAFMANQVWNYDLEKPSDLVYGYELPTPIFNKINEKTAEFLDSAIQRVTDEGSLSEKAYINDYVYLYFIEEVHKYLEGKFTEATVQKIFPKGAASNFSLTLFWINQIFAKNIKIDEKSISFYGTKLPVPSLNVSDPIKAGTFSQREEKTKAIIFASFFFQYLMFSSKEKIFVDVYTDLKQSFSKNNNANDVLIQDLKRLSSILQVYLSGKTLVNTNNYHLKNYLTGIKTQSVVGLNEITNDDIKENTYARLVAAQSLKKCKDTKSEKDETSLRLFYKEGNDAILNGALPPGGLGCDKNTVSWPAARRMLLDHISLEQPRQNKTLPYYNLIDSSVKSVIPKENDIAVVNFASSGLTSAAKETIKQFRTLLALDRFGGIEVSANGNPIPDEAGEKVLTDKSLMFRPAPDTSPFKAESWFLYWSFTGQAKGAFDAGDWAPDEYFNKIMTLLKYKNYSPRNGMFSAGYVLTKSRIADDGTGNIKQRIYISDPQFSPDTFKMLSPEGPFSFYDSQIKYGEKYGYQLNQLVTFTEGKYRYLFLSGIESNKDINPDSLFHFMFFPSPTEYSNKIEEIPISLNRLVVPFVDIPPHATFLEVHPLRGVNNKVFMHFQDMSFYADPQKRNIPRAFWQEGWQNSRDYYIENEGLYPESIKDGDVWFKNQPLQKIIIYKVEGEKPTNELDFKEIFEEVDVLAGDRLKLVSIKPNVQYYFATRSVSVTGLKSYLSQVYSVKIVDDGGTVFPVIDVVELESAPIKRKEIKEFTSLFRIEPALLQQAPNPAKNNVGYLSPSTFSDQNETKPLYKIRVTSKKTGRKVDFNLIYKLKKSTNDDNLGDISIAETRKKNILMSYASAPAQCKKNCSDTFRKCSDECKKDIDTFVVCLNKCGDTLNSCKQNCSDK